MLERAGRIAREALQRAGAGPPIVDGAPTQPASLLGAPTTTGIARGSPRAIRGHVFTPGAPGFESVAHVFNRRFDQVLPIAVARPVDARDVRDAIRFTVSRGVRVGARSGGHSYEGYSTLADGIVIDLHRLNSVTVDRRHGLATIGAGSQLIDGASALAREGAALAA